MTRGVRRHAGAVAAGLLLDQLLGDPPTRWHPVGWFGTAMSLIERLMYRDAVLPGIAYAGTGAAFAGLAATACPSTALATAVCVAGHGLVEHAHRVDEQLVAGDLPAARSFLPSLVGRDPAGLDEPQIARAVIESVAENTVDAIVAPACWAAVGGASGVFGHRAINTMDAMVGHRSDRYLHFGWAAARLDDVAAWVPARVTALLVAAVRPVAAPRVIRAVRRQAPAHPSPNAGVAEAAFAMALGLRLGGMNRYDGRVDLRPVLGDGRAPERADIRRATRLCRDVTAATIAALGLLAYVERPEQ